MFFGGHLLDDFSVQSVGARERRRQRGTRRAAPGRPRRGAARESRRGGMACESRVYHRLTMPTRPIRFFHRGRIAAARGIAVSNTPDVLTDCVADTAVGLMIGSPREIVGNSIGSPPAASTPRSSTRRTRCASK